jgi:hypothetical protein
MLNAVSTGCGVSTLLPLEEFTTGELARYEELEKELLDLRHDVADDEPDGGDIPVPGLSVLPPTAVARP